MLPPADGFWARSLRPQFRPVVFIALLLALGVAGLLVGRLVKGDDTSVAVSTPAASAPVARPKPAPAPPAAAPTPRWGPLSATPVGRLASPASRAAATVAGNRVVVLGGSGGDVVQLGDPTGVVRRVGTLPRPLASGAALAADGAVYLIGGEHAGATPSDEILRFDLASREVTSAGRFVEPLAGAGYVQSGDSLLIAGGWTGEKYATAVLRFSLPGTVDLLARLPEAVRDPAVALHAGKLYVAGGRTAAGLSRQVYVVDLGAGDVSILGRLPQAVAGASLVGQGRQLYLFGGSGQSGPVSAVVRIDPARGSIEPAGRMPRLLAFAATVRVGARTYVLGGSGSGAARTSIVRLGSP
jgi:N-acetylneuraminic acid mutarotase